MAIRASKDPQHPWGLHMWLLVMIQHIHMDVVDLCLHVLPCSGTQITQLHS